MSFLSVQFLVFFIVICFCYYKVENQRIRIGILLVASYVFYAYWDFRFLFFLLFQTVVSYVIGLRLQKSDTPKQKKAYITIGCVLLLIVLGFCKYFNFFLSSFYDVLNIEGFSSLQIIIPVGISFYTFQALSYVIDIYRGNTTARKSFLDVALYIGFFPQLLSGPIVLSYNLLPQLEEKVMFNKTEMWNAVQIFLNGVVKKYVIADRLAVCVDAVYAAPNAYSGASLLCAVIAYSFQLYCDFSGYSDMAIGIAKAFGFDLGKNFSIPYTTSNPTQFWKHWHISLSTWLMKYLYISLGGNRKGKFRRNINLMLTMVIGGLWHGANWTFVFWGVLHGFALIVHKWFMEIRKNVEESSENKILRAFKHIFCICLNFVFVTICWVFFRANSISEAFLILRRIFTWADGVSYLYVYNIIYGLLIVVANIIAYCKNSGEGYYVTLNMEKQSSKIIFCCAIGLILLLMYISSNPFIYVQF